jgi:predicted acetyltransferase
MALIVRPYTEADREGFARVRSRVYRGGAEIPPDENLLRPDTTGTLAELDGRIVAMELEIDMTCTVRGSVVPCAGIAAVGVLPEHRRTGVGLRLLTQALPIYRERGSAIAALMPFRASYYRRAGYATAGTRLSLEVPTDRLPKVEAELQVWELPKEDYSAIVPCFEEFALRFSGMNVRKEGQWFWQLGGDNRFALYAAGDPPEAYASVRLKTDFWVEQDVRDFAWTTFRGYRSMLAFFGSLCINKTSVKWWAPGNDPMLWHLHDQGLNATFDGPMMYRAVDVPALLRTLRFEETAVFRVKVIDPHLPDNEGPWKVTVGEKGSEVERASEADFVMEVGPFTQALLGEPSLASLRSVDGVQVESEAGFRSACAVMPHHPTFSLDFF